MSLFESGSYWPESIAHSSGQLVALAKSRGLRAEDVWQIQCGACGVASEGGIPALGFGHMPDCSANDDAIHFRAYPAPKT